MKKTITFGEIMLRLSPPDFLRFGQANSLNLLVGGGEANVALSLAMFDMPVAFVTRLPKHDIGELVIATLRARNVDVSHIERGGERVGIYFCETGAMQRASKVIYDRAHSALATIETGMIDWENVFQDADWFHWTGITPAVSEGAAMVCLEAIQMANKMGLIVSCDLNYRKNLWKWGKQPKDIMPELVEGCDIILGNEEDAEKVFGIHPEDVDITSGKVDALAYESVGEQLMAKFPKAKKVIITLRGSLSASHNTWSGVLWDGKTLFTAPTYELTHIVDRVGGGDSFMAGLIYGLKNFPTDDKKALEFAVASSCLKHSIYGDYNWVTVDEVEKLMSGDASGRVSR